MQRIGRNTTIRRAGRVVNSVPVALSSSALVVPLFELQVGVGMGAGLGATGELSFGGDGIGTGGNVGGVFTGGLTLRSGAMTGSCCRGGLSVTSMFGAFDLFLKMSTS